MTVAEIKAKLPEAEVFELRPDARYLIVLSQNQVPHQVAQSMMDNPSFEGIRAGIIFVEDPESAVKILEMVP